MGLKIALMVCVLGFGLSHLLTHLHFSPELSTPLCEVARNTCDSVLASKYAVIWGVPLSAFGMLYYLVLAMLVLSQMGGAPSRSRIRLLIGLVGMGLVVSALLVYAQAFVLHAFCPLCCSSALCCLALGALVASGRLQARADLGQARRWTLIALGLVAVARLSFGLFERPRTLDHVDYSLGHRLGEERPGALKVLVFFDFQCPYCRALFPLFQQLVRDNPNKVVVYYRDFPLAYHGFARTAAAAAQAAGEQGKYWDYAALLEQPGASLDEAALVTDARRLGLDVDRFDRDRRGTTIDQRLKVEQQDAVRSGIMGLPAIFANQTRVAGDASGVAAIRKLL
jgi:uncharacterized membrane protein/thiol-disulfide isomerase/thioredoxin